MNYLGHIFLSGKDEELLIGNFIGDYIKGNQFLKYPPKIREGIILHRTIDFYTDHNKKWQQIREILRPVYSRYSGVVSDVLCDHILAKHWNSFSKLRLDRYTKWVHAVLLMNYQYLPDDVKGFLPFLIQHKRLQSYSSIYKTIDALKIMAKNTSLPDNTQKLNGLLISEYNKIEHYALSFIHEISNFVNPKLNNS